jgi:hypothetical protein
MKPKFVGTELRAPCPDCEGAITTFEQAAHTGAFGSVQRQGKHKFEGRDFDLTQYILVRCAGCGRGGLLTMHVTNTGVRSYDEGFYPACLELAALPKDVPSDIVAEYREAELCASVGAYRAGSALLRSVLEKTLEANGYTKGPLKIRIDEAAKDGAITSARRQRAHDDIRVLGNDVLHDPWREVKEPEYSNAHHYSQRILEDFYDHRAEVLVTLKAAGRVP